MEQQGRGRGRARGRARPQDGGQQQRPGPPPQGPPQGGPSTGGRGRGGPPPRPGGAWGQQPPQQQPPPQQSAWGQPQPSAWGPKSQVQQQHQIRAPAPQAVPMQAGRASHRGGGDSASQVGQYESVAQGPAGDSGVAGAASRGAVRSGRRIECQNLVRTRPNHVATKQGTTGRKINLQANYIKMGLKDDVFMLYQYRVDFKPEVDLTPHKRDYMRDALRDITRVYIFDGSVLYTTQKLHPEPLEKFVNGKNEGEQICLIIKLVGDVLHTDYHYLQVFNLIMRKCISALKLTLVHRNYFDPHAKVAIHDYKMELWPGYYTSIRQHEREVLMCVEIIHKVMRTDTVLHILNECMAADRSGFREEFNRRVIGCTVLTPYNNKLYRVDDVDWNSSPLSTFEKEDGKSVVYKDYYKNRYAVVVKSDRPPLLVSNAKKHEIRAGKKEMIFLIPELCRMTGLTDSDRSNFQLMKALGEHTRIPPGPRIKKINEFSHRIRSCPEAVQELRNFDMTLSEQIIDLPGRVYEPETLLGGNSATYKPDQYADWTKSLRSCPMLQTGNIESWVLMCTTRFKQGAQSFAQLVCKAAAGMRWQLPNPRIVDIPDDRPQTYLNSLQQVIQQYKPSLVMCVTSNNKLDRYSAIKKKCTVEHPMPSQVILAKNLESKGAMSIATKVAIQLSCKTGGAPWGLAIPISNFMVVGYDACHDPHDKSKSYGALCASLNKTASAYNSNVSKHSQGEELCNYLAINMVSSCLEFRRVNGTLPDRIIFYRDGVGDGQLNYVIDHEVKSIIDTLQRDLYKEKPLRLAFIVVSKRIHTRLFAGGRNPDPGTIVDDVITLPERYDFFIVSQCVRQGTVSPTSYNIIHDTSGFNADQLQRLTYKLTHGYFNWSGTVRVPAPCQYAHKLAFLVSQALQRDPHPELRNSLYFL